MQLRLTCSLSGGGGSVDDTPPVLSLTSFDDPTDTATFTTTEGGTLIWATHLTSQNPVADGSGGWTGGTTLEEGSTSVTVSGSYAVPYTATTGTTGQIREVSYYVRDAAGNDSNLITEQFEVN